MPTIFNSIQILRIYFMFNKLWGLINQNSKSFIKIIEPFTRINFLIFSIEQNSHTMSL
ncbi:unnamed protein product [Paramecium sonneborni]|uniref:Uncharacterized protein n=1 Tax=Paramecium sonneborni TaxID=65129 RepID=A0A8S1PS64_9CILI|nr:unnamed protein product [Paramecium sonneborni]